MSKPSIQELENRIREVAAFCGGTLSRDDALAWGGYVAALVEWSLITVEDYDRLQALLGAEPAGPALSIFLGPDGARDVLERESNKKATATTNPARVARPNKAAS